jgi:hypothetical protein
LTEKYKFFVDIRYPWFSTDTVKICGIEDEDKYSPMTGIENGRRVGKLPPLIRHLVDIPI